jgi:hypothetical protein
MRVRVFNGQNWKANKIAKWCRQGYWEHFSWGVIIRASHPPLHPTPLRSFWFFERFSRRILWHSYLTEYSPWQQKHKQIILTFGVGMSALIHAFSIPSDNNSLLFTVYSTRARNDGMGAVKNSVKNDIRSPGLWRSKLRRIPRHAEQRVWRLFLDYDH